MCKVEVMEGVKEVKGQPVEGKREVGGKQGEKEEEHSSTHAVYLIFNFFYVGSR